MHIDKLSYSQSHETLSHSGLRTWYKFEAGGTVDQGENMEEAVAALKKFVQQNVFPDLGMANEYMGGRKDDIGIDRNGYSTDRTPKEQAIDSQIEAISGCTTLKSLEIFRKLVERENVLRLTEAYQKQMILLKDKP